MANERTGRRSWIWKKSERSTTAEVYTGPGLPSVGFTVSVDTEEDNWLPVRHDIRTTNILRLTQLAELFQRLNIRPTYFVTHQVVVNLQAATILRTIHAHGDAEIGAHLHPWNTPPFCGIEDGVSMLKEYPDTVQEQKIRGLVEAIEQHLGVRPRAFRAGRFGFGSSTAAALIRNGMFVDSSVTPLLSWKAYDNGPSFVLAPLDIYRFNDGAVLDPAGDDGCLVEVPVTIGYTRFRPTAWRRLTQLLEAESMRRLHVGGIASRMGFFRRVILSPETSSLRDMVEASRRLINGGARHLHMFLHSNSMVPGLNPFAGNEADVKRMLGCIEEYVHQVTRFAALRFCTVSEAAQQFAPVQPERSSRSARLVGLLGFGASQGWF